MMEDGSRKFIKDVKAGDRLMKGMPLRGPNIVEAVSIRSAGKDMIRIQPHDIRCSPEHLIYTDSGWKMAGDIKIGDRMKTRFTFSELRIFGFWIAEGYFEGSGPWTPALSNTDMRMLDSYGKALGKFGVSLIDRGKRCYACSRHPSDTYEENHFAKFLRYMGYTSKTGALGKFIPDELQSIGSFGKKMLLRGMWDGDGTRLGTQMRYYTSSHQLRDDVTAMLDSLDVGHSVYSYKPNENRFSDIPGTSIYIHREDEGFLNHTGRFETQTVLGWAPVTSIARVRTHENLYDLSTMGESFVANNVVVHNSKSMFLKQLLHPEFGILNNGSVPMRFAGSVTEAGWTGSSDGGSGSLVSVLGLAEKFKNGIVGMEEFAALNAIMEQQHSSHLEQALAMSLFEGDVEKDLKGVTISYHTDVTLWAGNQIMNFNLSGGLFRRFFHVYWTPRLSEAEVLSKAVWLGDDKPPNRPRMLNYRAELLGISPRIHGIQEIEFTDRFKAAIAGVPHFEKSLYKAFGIGYTIMSDTNIPQKLIVDADPQLRELLDMAVMWRKQLLADPRGFQVESLLYDLEADTFPVKWSRVRELNLMFSVSYFDTDEIIRNLLRAGRVKYNSHDKTLKLA